MNLNEEKSKKLSIITTIKSKVPAFILFVHLSIVTHIYGTDCKNVEEYIFWIYYPILSIICFLWEFLYLYFNLKDHYHILDKKDYLYCTLSSIISLWSFIVTSYYMQDGKPFSCYFNYDKNVASILLYISYAIIFGYSSLEKYFFQREQSLHFS